MHKRTLPRLLSRFLLPVASVFAFACSPPPDVNVAAGTAPNVTIQESPTPPPTVNIFPPPPTPTPAIPVVRFGVLENGADNFVLWYDAAGNLLQRISTHGFGGASGNANGAFISPDGQRLVAVNTLSNSVTVYHIADDGSLAFLQLIPTDSKPVSVAFGDDKLFVVGESQLEAFPRYGYGYSTTHASTATIPPLSGPAQVGYATDGVVSKVGVSLKGDDAVPSGAFVLYDLSGGLLTGTSTAVALPVGDNKTPFGFYAPHDKSGSFLLSLAHANKNTLVVQGVVKDTKPSTEAANCWVTCTEPSPLSKQMWQRGIQCWTANTGATATSITALHTLGQSIVIDHEPAVKLTNGKPIDIHASSNWLVARVSGAKNYLNVYAVSDTGSLVLGPVITLPDTATSANAVVSYEAADYGR